MNDYFRAATFVLIFAAFGSTRAQSQNERQIPPTKIVIETMQIDGVSGVGRQQLATALKGRVFEGDSDRLWFDKRVAKIIHEALMTEEDDRELVYCWNVIRREPSEVTPVSLTINLKPPLRLANIRFVNISDPSKATVFPPRELRSLMPLRDGDVYSHVKVEEGFDVVSKLYHSSGYVDLVLNYRLRTDEITHTASLIVELNEGRAVSLGRQ